MLRSNAKWIWINENPEPEEYGCFKESFSAEKFDDIKLRISAETDYIAYVNGMVAGFSQFPGYPFEKYYDEIDITEFCHTGENELVVTARYEGTDQTFTHIKDGAGVVFEIESDGEILACSSEETVCGFDGRYIQHAVRSITPQLGLTSGMKVGEPVFDRKAVLTNQTYNLKKTPVDKTVFSCFENAKPMGDGIYDLGRETAGYLYVKVKSEKTADFKVCYGEHIEDGRVRQIIGVRDFSIDFRTEKGEHEFVQYFIRVACRYLQIKTDADVEIVSLGVLHFLYPLTEKPFDLSKEDGKIYKTSVRTLRLCMNHHYEDCPWREQSMYIVDSRNQMLCGYYAFEETKFQRENILFMAKGDRGDGFFELTFPATGTPSIPFFTIMYPVVVAEYIEHTGDKEILREIMPQITAIMENTKKRIDEKGLVPDFEAPFWNFYEWAEGADGNFFSGGEDSTENGKNKYHLILNCAFVYAGERYLKLCEMAGVECNIDFESVKNAICKEFYDEATGLFANRPQKDRYSQLGNAFALLIGLGDGRTVEALKCDGSLVPATLSMSAYVYDALLDADFEGNREYILADIRQKYNYMLGRGATSFWETILGEADFDGAGSLCHGWSGMPVYYYNILKKS